MSDDLISRKELLKRFIVSESGRRIPEYDIDNFPIQISIKDVKDIIRKLPAAFDKEKVKEELTAGKFITIGGNTVGESVNIRIDRAVEIVEKGGIE